MKREKFEDKRKPLKCGELTLREYGKGGASRTFRIIEKINSGSTVISYKAEADEEGVGVLKEFYPIVFRDIVRASDGRLICPREDSEEFFRRLEDYIKPLKIIISGIRRSEDIAGFIPKFEIYGRKKKKKDNDTVYVWCSQPECRTFESVCREIHENPDIRPEHKLKSVLRAIQSLAECISVLHGNGLVHCDIKPANFGFAKRNGKVLYDSITFFDVDSISYLFSDVSFPAFTEGFTAPEVCGGGRRHDFLSDIYSIGAALFYAVIINNVTKKDGFLYRDEYFNDIERLVNESELIKSSSGTFYAPLRAVLVRILKNTLCRRERRYRSCRGLSEDIGKALYYLAPADGSDHDDKGEWVRKEEKHFEADIMHCHFYENSFVRNIPKDRDTVTVLVSGLGTYGKAYADSALSALQIPGRKLVLYIFYEEPEEKKEYLEERPELKNFFNVDGSLEGDAGSYGDIVFIRHRADMDNNGLSLLSTAPDCIFAAAGGDKRNIELALSCKEAIPKAQVSFACEKKTSDVKRKKGIIPVYVRNTEYGDTMDELERMGFNVHLLWNDNLNIDFGEIKKEFNKKYNRSSSMSFVVSLRYKFPDMPDIGSSGFGKWLDNFADIAGDKEKLAELAYIEHRRWLTEKICSGYKRAGHLEIFSDGSSRDDKKKLHGCIVRSTKGRKLNGGIWSKDGHPDFEIWDDPPEDEFEKLDPLDRVSVNLHRVYKKSGESESNENMLDGDTVQAIKGIIKGNTGLLCAFQELITCMKDILADESGRNGSHRMYMGMKNQFIDALWDSELKNSKKDSVEDLFKSLDKRFRPVYRSRSFIDYKENDEKLILGVPFILTYSANTCMAVPYQPDGKEIFTHLDAPTAMNPKKLIFPVYCGSRGEAEQLCADMPCIAGYMKRKKLRASAEYFIGVKKHLDVKCLRSAAEKRKINIKIITAESIDAFLKPLKDYLAHENGRKKSFMLEKKSGSVLSGKMDEKGFYDIFPSYSYNCREMSFENINGCRMTEFIKVNPFITVYDMFSFRGAVSVTSSKPEFYHCGELWALFREKERCWKELCGALGALSEKNDVIVGFTKKNAEENTEFSCLFPHVCRKSAEKISDYLFSAGIIDKKFDISMYNTELCRIKAWGDGSLYEKLFSDPHRLMNHRYVSCEKDGDGVKVLFNDLCVRELDMEGLSPGCFELLKILCGKGYLLSLRREGSRVSFAYSSPKVKKLFISENELLRVYVYHKAYDTGEFDDIRSGFETLGSDESFDCILTSGYSSLFVGCVTGNPSEEFCESLRHGAEVWGINARAVIVADGANVEPAAGITIISDRKEIDDIGNVLANIINKKGVNNFLGG